MATPEREEPAFLRRGPNEVDPAERHRINGAFREFAEMNNYFHLSNQIWAYNEANHAQALLLKGHGKLKEFWLFAQEFTFFPGITATYYLYTSGTGDREWRKSVEQRLQNAERRLDTVEISEVLIGKKVDEARESVNELGEQVAQTGGEVRQINVFLAVFAGMAGYIPEEPDQPYDGQKKVIVLGGQEFYKPM